MVVREPMVEAGLPLIGSETFRDGPVDCLWLLGMPVVVFVFDVRCACCGRCVTLV